MKRTPIGIFVSVIVYWLTLAIAGGAAATEKVHVVKKGDSIARIADFYGVSQRDLKDANGIGKGSIVDIGDKLVIPDVLRKGAQKSHVIKSGDTLVQIAKKYKVSVRDLAQANKIKPASRLSLGKTLVIPGSEDEDYEASAPSEESLKIDGGRQIKGGVLHTVQPGQSIWLIARAYNTSGDRIARRNRIEKTAPLSVGQELVIPGASLSGKTSHKRSSGHTVRFARVQNSQRLNLRLLNNKGRVIQGSRLALSKLARDRRGKKRYRLLHPRLIQLLQRVADHFPGETIEIISGYRAPRTRGHLSKHNVGAALDFRVTNVSNKELFAFIKTLPKTGAGYYPNSVFVHLDVRDRSSTWTDISGPGETAHYIKPGEGATDDQVEAAADNAPDEEPANADAPVAFTVDE
ncbi:MAG: LysM peptidoglycan-binding domain-containing protein [Deltaproteobacteria bacterium]|nr:LysM peptidoglycan-binding domain-containing protein [Deltaproteobacteria bacterium]